MNTPGSQALKQRLGRGFSIAACMGTIIGLGILRTPGEIAQSVQAPGTYLALWVLGGLFALFSTLVVVELIALTPRSGGLYALMANAYGPYPGFLVGWTDWLAQCASGALKAVVLMEYAALLVPDLRPWVVPGALAINTAFALLQLGGVRLSGGIHQAAATGFGLILLGVSLALLLGPAPAEPAMTPAAPFSWAGLGLVVAAIVFTYDGWMGASYYSAEVKGGSSTAARGSVIGVLIVIALYLVLNGVLLLSVPLGAIAGHELALAGALELLYGPGAAAFVIAAAIFILLAHQNLQYMASCRIIYALSVDGLGSQKATGVSRRGTPQGALLVTWALMTTLILAGGFEFLLAISALLFILGYVGILLGVFHLRRKSPDLERPVRAWGHPVTGVLCVGGWGLIALFVAVTDPASGLWTLGMVSVSIPVYLWLKRRSAAPRGPVQPAP